MKRLLSIIVVFLLFNSLCSCSWFKSGNIQPGRPTVPVKKAEVITSTNWLQWRNNCLHTGASPDNIPDDIPTNPKWDFNSSASGYKIELSSPVIYENNLFIILQGETPQQNKLACFDKNSGDCLWFFSTLSQESTKNMIIVHLITPTIAVYPENASQYHYVLICTTYLNSNQSRLIAINMDTHKPVWIAILGGKIISSPTIWEGTVAPVTSIKQYIFLSSNDHVFCYDVLSGHLMWSSIMIPNPTSATITTDLGNNNKVYVGSSNANLYSLDVNNGNLFSFTKVDGPIETAPVIYKNWIYFGSSHTGDPTKGHFYCYNRDDMQYNWHYSVQNDSKRWNNTAKFNSAPCINEISADTAYIFASCTNGRIYCFQSHIPNPYWQINPVWSKYLPPNTNEKTIRDINSYIVLSNEGKSEARIIVSKHSNHRKLYMLKASDGSIVWQTEEISKPGFNSTPTVNGANFYIGDLDGHVLCFGK